MRTDGAAENRNSLFAQQPHGALAVRRTHNDAGAVVVRRGEKGVHIFHADLRLRDRFHHVRKPAGAVGHRDGDGVGERGGQSGRTADALGLFGVVHDQTQDAEAGRVGYRERADVDAAGCEDARDLRHPSGLVFHKHGKLLDEHRCHFLSFIRRRRAPWRTPRG